MHPTVGFHVRSVHSILLTVVIIIPRKIPFTGFYPTPLQHTRAAFPQLAEVCRKNALVWKWIDGAESKQMAAWNPENRCFQA